jgi:hypothetical protein
MYDMIALVYGEEKKVHKKPKLSDVFVMNKKKSNVNNKKKKTDGKDSQGNKKKKPENK